MKALSLRQPWGSAIVYDDKRIENRRWPLLRNGMTALDKMLPRGERFAIHGSMTKIGKFLKPDAEMVESTVSRPMTPAQKDIRGCVIGTAKVIDVIRATHPKQPVETRRGWPIYELNPADRDRIVYDTTWTDLAAAVLTPLLLKQDQIDRWWMGPYALVLDEVKTLKTPVACPGRLYFWDLPPDVEAAVKEQLP